MQVLFNFGTKYDFKGRARDNSNFTITPSLPKPFTVYVFIDVKFT